MIRFIVVFLLLAQTASAQIPKGFKQATMPGSVSNRDIRLMDMQDGDCVWAFNEALFVDDAGKVWLKPTFIGAAPKSSIARISELEIDKSRLGYYVRIHPYLHKTNGYSFAKHSSWTRGGTAPPGYIPVTAVTVVQPYYGPPPSAYDELTRSLQRPYQPSFTKPQVPPNPYSFGGSYVRPGSQSGTARPSPAASTGPKPADALDKLLAP